METPKPRNLVCVLTVLALLAGSGVSLTSARPGPAPLGTASLMPFGDYDGPGASLHGYFTENLGQVRDPAVRFYASAGSHRIAFLDGAVLLVQSEAERTVVLRLDFVGAGAVAPRGSDEAPHRSNFFHGSDRSGWVIGAQNFRTVGYADLYPGIDLVYAATAAGAKYEFHVRPGADPTAIEVAVTGPAGLGFESGELVLATPIGALRDSPPVAF